MPSNPGRPLARDHAARCRVLGRARIYQYERSLRPCIAWCSQARASAASLDKALALVTCAELPEGEEAELLEPPLRSRGIEPTWAVWDDPAIDWAAFDLVVVRSAWDCAERWREFLRWAESVPRIENPLPVLQFGIDKERYLTTLAGHDVPTMPTEFVHPGAPFVPLPRPFVVKPAISAGGRRSARFEAGDVGAGDLVAEITGAGGTAMVQPLVDGVPETSLVFIDGTFSHSLSRSAALPAGRAEQVLYLDERLGPAEATAEERKVAEAALKLVPGPWLYARVDLLGGAVLELEVVEPSLYLGYDERAADRLAEAIARRLEATLRP